MNRRSFFQSLAVVGAAAALAPSILIPRCADHARWKKTSPSGIWIPNPEYFSAPYEICFTPGDKQVILEPAKHFVMLPPGLWPMRFKNPTLSDPIPPFIQA